MKRSSTLREALALMSVRLVLEQIGLALLVFLLYALWLKMPDASVLDVMGSVVLTLVVIAVAGGGESAIMLRLAGNARTVGRLLRGALLLMVGVALWFAWGALLDHVHGDDYLWAGYLNSRLPRHLRYLFTYSHIALWLRWMWTTLEWIGAGAIGLLVFAGTASSRPLRAVVHALHSITYWLAVLLGAIGASVFMSSLMNWVPGHGLRVEFLSLVLRLGAAILVDALVVCFLLAILAARMRRSEEGDASHSTPGGTPADSQPRTVENP